MSTTTTTSTTEKKGSIFSRIFSVSDQFANYYFYHQSKTNQLIHFIFVPVIALSVMMLVFKVDMQQYGIVKSVIVDSLGLGNQWCNLAVVAFVFLSIYYLVLDLIAGSLLSAEFLGMLILSNYLSQKWIDEPSTYYILAAILQVIGWGTQFYGHYLEGKRPALIDNVFQIFIAPLFVLFELLFMLGIRLDLKEVAERKLKEKNLAVAATYSKRNKQQ